MYWRQSFGEDGQVKILLKAERKWKAKGWRIMFAGEGNDDVPVARCGRTVLGY